MRALRHQLAAVIALLAVIFSTVTPASATISLPSGSGPMSAYILKISDVAFAQLNSALQAIGVSPSQEYSQVFKGFAASLTDDQKSYLETLLPGLEIFADLPITLNDTQNDAAWNLSDLDEAGNNQDANYKYPTSAGEGVRVYVLDTGVNANTSQFGTRLLAGVDFTGSGSYLDGNGHGTHVAGTIASVRFGVAKKASIVPVRVLNAAGSGSTSQAVAGIDWVIRNKPAGTKGIINMSLGSDVVDSATNTAVRSAVNAGILVVGAAGNESTDACLSSPASASETLTVGSVNASHDLSSFSNTGSCVDILAQGESIASLNYLDSSASSRRVLQGTSMATPHVAGAAALYWALHPTATVAAVRAALIGGADNDATTSANTVGKVLDISFMNTKPESVTSPSVPSSQAPVIGETLSSLAGTWRAATTYSVAKQWFACATAYVTAPATLPSDCVAIPGARADIVSVGRDQIGQYLLIEESAQSENGATASYSATSARVVEASTATLRNDVSPSISLVAGTSYGSDSEPRVYGDSSTTLKANSGTWVNIAGGTGTIGYGYKWFRCASEQTSTSETLPGGCIEIADAQVQNYTVTAADVNSYILAGVTASNSDSSKLVYTRSSAKVSKAPTIILPTELNALAEYRYGSVLTAAAATFDGAPTPNLSYAWYACSTAVATAGVTKPAGCNPITGATALQFTPTAAQKGLYLLLATQARNSATGTTSVSSFSKTTETAVVASPVLKYAVTGSNGTVKFTQATPITGNTKITVDLTGWLVASSYQYSWYRCDEEVAPASTAPTNCDPISGATVASYTVTSNDVGKFVTAYVVAKNAAQATVSTATLLATARTIQAPVNISAPTVPGGVVAVGNTISATAGNWSASPAVTYGYQWFSCSAAVTVAAATKNAKCVAIASAKSSTYEVPAAMNNKYLMVQVSASNAANATAPVSYYSVSTSKVLTATANTAAPTLSYSVVATTGQPVVGAIVSAKSGAWTGNPAPTKSFKWYLCDSAVEAGVHGVQSDCNELSGETGSSVTALAAWRGKYLTVAESGVNPVNTVTSFAAVSLTIQNKPIFASDPRVVGGAKSGNQLTANSGASNIGGSPTVEYLWLKCDSAQVASDLKPAGCSDLTETNSSITVTTAFEGAYLLVKVILRNVAGTTVRYSATSSQVAGDATNLDVRAPTISAGHARFGTEMRAGSSTWTGFPAGTLSYNWYKCTAAVATKSSARPTNCNYIPGADSETYTPVAGDVGKFLSVKVTNSQNGVAVASAYSPTSEQVFRAPSFGDRSIPEPRPTLGAQHLLNESSLTLDIGTTHGFPENDVTYRWYRCETASEVETATKPAGCDLISGATTTSYDFAAEDVGYFIVASVTLVNDVSEVTAFTASSAMVESAPVNKSLRAPTVGQAGEEAKVDVTLSASAGSWTQLPAATYTYQWFRCTLPHVTVVSTQPNDCTAIGTGTSYQLKLEDSGKYILSAVTALNIHGQTIAFSPTTSDVHSPADFTATPLALSGTAVKGALLSSNLPIRGWPTPNVSYRWLRCLTEVPTTSSIKPTGCDYIKTPAALLAEYSPVDEDVTKYLVKEITIQNHDAKVTRYTASSRQVYQTPELSGKFEISGTQWFDEIHGHSLEASPVTLKAFPPTVEVYQWYRDSVPISGAQGRIYVLTRNDVSHQISYTVTATNSAGSDGQSSEPTEEIGLTPRITNVNSNPPGICGLDSGDREIPAGVSAYPCSGDFWTANPPVDSYKYQWYLCTPISVDQKFVEASSTGLPPTNSKCQTIKSSSDDSVLATFKDEGKFLAYSVTVKNGTEDVSYFVKSSNRIYVKPLYKTGAKVVFPAGQAASDGSPRVGYQIDVTNGTWLGDSTNTYSYQWFTCRSAIKLTDVDPVPPCVNINNANSKVFTVTEDLVGLYLGVRVTGAYKYNSVTDDTEFSNRDIVYTATTAKPVIAPPSNRVPPQITTRYTYVGATMKSTDGEWEGTPVITKSHTWWECTQPIYEPTKVKPTFCTKEISKSVNLLVSKDQLGKYIASVAKASNIGGEVYFWSTTQDVVKTGPVNVEAPIITINGSKVPGTNTELTVSDGKWKGDPDPGAPSEYNWYSCETAVKDPSEFLDGGCLLIENASQNKYTPQRSDVGSYILASVKATNIHGDWVAYTSSTARVNLPPANLTVPTIPATAFVGRTVTGNKGVWEGDPEPTFTYQWYVCDSKINAASATKPSGCAAIENATKDNFKPTVSQIDGFLVLEVIAENLVGKKSHFTASSDTVVSGPVLKTAPVYAYPGSLKNPLVGAAVTSDGGVWDGKPTPTEAFQWMVCDQAPTAAEIDGQKDVATDTLDPLKFLADKHCVDIPGATIDTFTPTEELRGKFLIAHILATNDHGSDDWYTAPTTAVWMAPVVDHHVEVFGKTFNQLQVKAKNDTWKAFPEPTKTYTWFYCTDIVSAPGLERPAGCNSIAGAAAANYRIPELTTPTQKYMVVKVVAHNAAGADAVSYSATSNLIEPGPANIVPPAITGTTTFALGKSTVLTATTGTWVPTTNQPTKTFQWYRCSGDKPIAESDELNPACEILSGQTENTYELTENDPGKLLLVAVRGENGIGFSITYSRSTAPITEKMNNTVAPSINGLPKLETTITGVEGNWRGFPLPTAKQVQRQWYVCTAAIPTPTTTLPAKTCTAVSTKETLTVDTDEVLQKTADGRKRDMLNNYLVYSVTKWNTIDGKETPKVTWYSTSTQKVALSPISLAKPEILPLDENIPTADQPKVGQKWTLKSSWKNSPTLGFEWYRCDALVNTGLADIVTAPVGCSVIEGISTKDYTIRVADQGKYLMGKVTATNVSDVVVLFTNTTEQAVAQPPIADPKPAVTGIRKLGEILTVSPGTWSPVGTAAATYAWYRCTTAIADYLNEVPSTCTNTSETGATFEQTEGVDDGSFVTVFVTASFQGSTTGYLVPVSQSTSQSPKIPVGGVKPALDNDGFRVGDLFLVNPVGTWVGSPTPDISHQWYRCANQVEDGSATLRDSARCTAIAGADGGTYVAKDADDGSYLLVSETATNASGTATWFTESTGAPIEANYVPDSTFVSVSASSLAITPTNSVTITSSSGTWKRAGVVANPVLIHRWVFCTQAITTVSQRVPVDKNGSDVCFPMFESDTLDPRDSQPLVLGLDSRFAGFYIGSIEYVLDPGSNPNVIPDTFKNIRYSQTTGKILMQPTLWTTPYTNDLLAANAAGTTGYQAPRLSTMAYQVGAGTTRISPTQVNTFLSTTLNVALPGSTEMSATQTITWRGVGDSAWRPNVGATTPYGYGYQWFRCSQQITQVVATKPDSCTSIPDATNASYLPTSADVGSYLSLRITASNSVGSTSIWTASTWHITQVASNTIAPSMSTVTQVGDTAEVTPGEWTGLTTPDAPTYEWYLCSATTISAANCGSSLTNPGQALVRSTARSYTIPSFNGSNVTRYLLVKVSSKNYPFLLSDQVVNQGAPWSTSVTIASGRLYEKPLWLTSSPSVNLKDSTGTVLNNKSANKDNLAARVGETLTMENSAAAWSATEAPTSYDFAWFSCSEPKLTVRLDPTPPASCTALTGENTSSIQLKHSHAGMWIAGRITATNSRGEGSSWTITTPRITEDPYNIDPPSIAPIATPKPAVKDTLTAVDGNWGGDTGGGAPGISFTYQWYSCTGSVSASSSLQPGCNAIPGATAKSYTLASAEMSKHVLVAVTATNQGNPMGSNRSKTHFSASIGDVLMDPEFGASDPIITGSYHVGYTLSLTPLTVTSNPAATTTWAWYVCTSTSKIKDLAAPPSDCVKQGDGNERSLVIDSSMAGRYIALFASSINRTTPTKRNSAFTTQVTQSPTNTSAPTVSGRAVANGTNKISGTGGSWEATPSVNSRSYNWYLCTSPSAASSVKPSTCTIIAGTYSANTPADLLLNKREWAEKYVVLEETATQTTNATGNSSTLSSKYYSATSDQIFTPTEFKVAPSLSGYSHLDETLAVTFESNPAFNQETVSYAWYSCTSAVGLGVSVKPVGCTLIANAASDTYAVKAEQVGTFVTSAVTLHNDVSDTTLFAATSTRASRTPLNTAAATVAGDDVIATDKKITASQGTWLSSPTATYSYEWFYCDTQHASAAAKGSDCTTTGQTGKVLSLAGQNRFAGKYLQVVEKATSSGVTKPGAGEASFASATIGPIRLIATFSSSPVINGVLHVGQTLTATRPTVEAYPTASSDYSWYQCATQTTPVANCTLIPNTLNDDLVLTSDQAGKSLILQYTYVNSAGTASKASSNSVLVTTAPTSTVDPAISGSSVYSPTALATVSKGTWTGTPSPTSSTYTYAYSWYLCDSQVAAANSLSSGACSATVVGSAASISLTTAMDGKYLVAKVTATAPTNQTGGTSTSRFSAGFGPIAVAATSTTDPTMSDMTPALNQAITATGTGTWVSNTRPITTPTYTWYACNKAFTTSLTALPLAADCTEIAGFTDATFTPTSKYSGKRIMLVVSVSNAGGKSIRTSRTTSAVPTGTTTASIGFRLY